MLQVDRCKVEDLGKNIYRIRPTALDNNGYIELTGAAKTVRFPIDRPHRLLRLEAHHTDNVKADSVDSLALTLSRLTEMLLWQVKYYNPAIIVADIEALFEENENEYGPTSYRIIANSTITDRLYWELYVRLLEGS